MAPPTAHLTFESSPLQSVCSPFCDPVPNLSTVSSSTPASATPSVYLTFKVLRLVNTFRQRVKTRVQSAKRSTPKKSKAAFCQDFERLAFEKIDQYLGRRTTRPLKKTSESKILATRATEQPSSISNTQWLLAHIDQAVKAETLSLTSVASSNTLFIGRRTDLAIAAEDLSTSELTQLLVSVKDLLGSLNHLSSSDECEYPICEDKDQLEVNFDENTVANLEHLLLCLEDQLIKKLVDLVYKHISDCQRDQTQNSEHWFLEYPNALRPLSTTWPWNIRPSLAVLWGVCWMFYDRHPNQYSSNSNTPFRRPPPRFDSYGNMLDEQDQVIATSAQVVQFLSEYQQQNHGFYLGETRQDQMPRPNLPPQQRAIPHSMTQPHRGLMEGGQSSSPSHSSISQHHTPRDSPAPPRRSPVPHAPTAAFLTQQAGVAPGASASFELPATNNTYAAAPRAYDARPAASDPSITSLPEDPFPFDYNPYQPGHAWSSIPQHSAAEQQQAAAALFYTHHPLPPRPRHTQPPTISVSTDFSAYQNTLQQPVQPAPQDVYQSATPVTSASSAHGPNPFNYPTYNPNQLSTGFMNPEQREMQTPPHSPNHPTGGGESVSRKRSHSIMSAEPGVPHSNGSRSGSVASMVGAGEEYRTRAFKRDEPPPMNPDGKIICTFAPECAGLTFDRKCEWTKHMDKHDRPYRCSNPACAKLQGFTYSGGLLRHEREVHNKHGGPKAQLMCPYKDCKRHSGKGFTRKENLNEHIRRVHQSKDEQGQGLLLKHDADVFPGAEEIDPAVRGDAFEPEDHLSPARKRRRPDASPYEMNGASDDVESLKREIQFLREDNLAKDNRIMEMELRLEEEKQSRQQEMTSLHESMRQLQQQGQVQS